VKVLVFEAIKKNYILRIIFLITVWTVLLVASLSSLPLLLTTYVDNPQVQSVVSLSWSGYVVASDFSSPQPQVIGISAKWTIPTVNASTIDTYSSAWIGIGGHFDKSLIQIGTEHDYVNGKERFRAWYELLPEYAISIPMNISQGHAISASINLVDSEANLWNLQLTDLTNGEGFNENFVYNSTRLSAEWIVERPSLNNQITYLSNFGTVTFTDAQVNINHEVASIADMPFAQIHMTNNQNTQLTSVSSLNPQGTSFTVQYITSG
jgi:hypothetical protein